MTQVIRCPGCGELHAVPLSDAQCHVCFSSLLGVAPEESRAAAAEPAAPAALSGASPGEVRCAHCKADNPATESFCEVCGEPLPAPLERSRPAELRFPWGASYPVDPVFHIGRDPAFSPIGEYLRVHHDNLSRRHARLTRVGPHVLLEDLGSLNGTFVGGQALEAHQPRQIGENTAIRFAEDLVVLLKFGDPG